MDIDTESCCGRAMDSSMALGVRTLAFHIRLLLTVPPFFIVHKLLHLSFSPIPLLLRLSLFSPSPHYSSPPSETGSLVPQAVLKLHMWQRMELLTLLLVPHSGALRSHLFTPMPFSTVLMIKPRTLCVSEHPTN